jgi:hypothetical protein
MTRPFGCGARWASGVAFELTVAALGSPRPVRADVGMAQIAINGPRAKVWAILTDLPSYPSLNPFIRRIERPLTVGGTITADLYATTLKPRTVNAKILIVWSSAALGGSLPGLFSGDHCWILRDRPDGGADLEQSEVFRGVMAPFIKPERLRVDYEAVDKAMKARAEAP